MTLRLVSNQAAAPERKGAAGWAARLDRGDLDAEENAAFEAWLGEPGNPEAYADAAVMLHVFDGLDPDLGELAALRSEAHRERLRTSPVPPAVVVPSRPWAGRALAASFIAALLLVGYASLKGKPFEDTPRLAELGGMPRPATATYRTKVGEQREISLADGSKVTLNTDSEILVAYRAKTRAISLVRGQVLFDVAHAPDRPFSVVAAGRKMTALGTIFEVRFDQNRLKVTLLEGKVRVQKAAMGTKTQDTLAILAPGQQLVSVGGLAPVIESVDIDNQLLWRRSLIEFENETVKSAIAELNRYSATQIVVADPHVAQMRMSGIVRTGDIAEFTELVGAMLPIAARKNAQGSVELYHAP